MLNSPTWGSRNRLLFGSNTPIPNHLKIVNYTTTIHKPKASATGWNCSTDPSQFQPSAKLQFDSSRVGLMNIFVITHKMKKMRHIKFNRKRLYYNFASKPKNLLLLKDLFVLQTNDQVSDFWNVTIITPYKTWIRTRRCKPYQFIEIEPSVHLKALSFYL